MRIHRPELREMQRPDGLLVQAEQLQAQPQQPEPTATTSLLRWMEDLFQPSRRVSHGEDRNPKLDAVDGGKELRRLDALKWNDGFDPDERAGEGFELRETERAQTADAQSPASVRNVLGNDTLSRVTAAGSAAAAWYRDSFVAATQRSGMPAI